MTFLQLILLYFCAVVCVLNLARVKKCRRVRETRSKEPAANSQRLITRPNMPRRF
ncbi:TPA: DUF1378 family protein [Escherichia coli]|nr:DUF1378 family protein [Escherichia coli]HBA9842680.1 DUF1378 family protein [Escherichia coli]